MPATRRRGRSNGRPPVLLLVTRRGSSQTARNRWPKPSESARQAHGRRLTAVLPLDAEAFAKLAASGRDRGRSSSLSAPEEISTWRWIKITPVVVQIESFRRPLEGQIAGARLIGVGSYAVVVTPG